MQKYELRESDYLPTPSLFGRGEMDLIRDLRALV